MGTGIGVGIAGQVYDLKPGVPGGGGDIFCEDNCSVNFSNVFGGTQTQWLSGAQGTAMTFGAGGIGDFSIAFWIYPTNLTTGDNMRICDFGSGALTPPNGRIQIHINTSGTAMTTTLKVNDTALDPSGGTNLPFPQDTWTHVVWTATRDATSLSGKWYGDGVFVGNTDVDPFPQLAVGPIPGNVVTTATTGPFYIGRNGGSTGMFEGNLDDFTIWNRALTAPEIGELMKVSTDPSVCMDSLSFYSDLTHWWEMGDPNGSASYPYIPDVIGAQNMEMKGMTASNIDCTNSPQLYTYIPDANFRTYLTSAYGVVFPLSMPEYCLTSSINTITTVVAGFLNITDLTGIEAFTALTDLTCYNNQLTSLDVSQNTALTDLYCRYNQITSLDVSQNTALTYLRCDNNQLTSLDVSNNTALDILNCGYNELTSLDVSNNLALTDLTCQNNQLTTLDVSQNTILSLLKCQTNNLTILDLTQNTALTYLNCFANQLTSLNVKNGNNTAISTANFNAKSNLFSCISVSDTAWAIGNWTNVDAGVTFSLSFPC